MEGQKRGKVNLASRRPFVTLLKSQLKETFFPDDPFRHFSGQPAARRFWSTISYFVPILQWMPKYSLAFFGCDFFAGVTIASLAIPQGISYAKLAQIPPIIGLYSSSVPPLVYAMFGSSNNMAVGPVAAASLLMAAIIQEIVSPEEEPERYVYTIITAAFFTGLLQLTLGIFRLGIIVDFLARSTITGFMGGTAMIIILQQLKGFLGLKHFTNKTDVISVLHAIIQHRSECKWQSAVLGIGLMIFLLFARQLKKKIPKLFWVNAVAPLVVVIVGGVIAYLVDGETHGIPIVGDLKRGLNPITISNLQFKSPYVSVAMKAGIITGFIALAEGVAVGRSLALLKNEQIDGNKEMIAFGLMNIAGSFTSCYLTTGPFSKSAVNYHAGCKTPMSNAVMAVCMMLVLLFLAPLFKYTPLVALAVIIIVAMIGVIELHELRHLFKVDKFDFCLCMAALLGVLFINMKTGLVISFLLSIIRALLHVARPVTYKLGNLPGTDLYRDIDQYPDSKTISGILILQLGSPIYFANASYLRERIARWVEAEENRIKETRSQDLQYVIFDMSGVSAIDNSGIAMMLEAHKMLQKKGIKVALTNPSLKVVEKFTAANFIEAVGKEWFFISINDAVAGCHFAMQEANETGV
ncbi:probable sulfate transporter 3.5 [Dendrobium catenatum]|uniref:Sulfate transporter 3.1 n=1 Tax=Dendrobium catenatum TaxID=906689 RepID=A0A2I0X5I1_9ASPA|nr:probable sulfate transporter 3.5 [Dendrobium catenatum]PKU83162.1 Sulfate transporter 3.1 [Dendrobium catenatum]